MSEREERIHKKGSKIGPFGRFFGRPRAQSVEISTLQLKSSRTKKTGKSTKKEKSGNLESTRKKKKKKAATSSLSKPVPLKCRSDSVDEDLLPVRHRAQSVSDIKDVRRNRRTESIDKQPTLKDVVIDRRTPPETPPEESALLNSELNLILSASAASNDTPVQITVDRCEAPTPITMLVGGTDIADRYKPRLSKTSPGRIITSPLAKEIPSGRKSAGAPDSPSSGTEPNTSYSDSSDVEPEEHPVKIRSRLPSYYRPANQPPQSVNRMVHNSRRKVSQSLLRSLSLPAILIHQPVPIRPPSGVFQRTPNSGSISSRDSSEGENEYRELLQRLSLTERGPDSSNVSGIIEQRIGGAGSAFNMSF